MQDGTRIIFEAASALRTLMGKLDWPKEGRTKPKTIHIGSYENGKRN